MKIEEVEKYCKIFEDKVKTFGVVYKISETPRVSYNKQQKTVEIRAQVFWEAIGFSVKEKEIVKQFKTIFYSFCKCSFEEVLIDGQKVKCWETNIFDIIKAEGELVSTNKYSINGKPSCVTPYWICLYHGECASTDETTTRPLPTCRIHPLQKPKEDKP